MSPNPGLDLVSLLRQCFLLNLQESFRVVPLVKGEGGRGPCFRTDPDVSDIPCPSSLSRPEVQVRPYYVGWKSVSHPVAPYNPRTGRTHFLFTCLTGNREKQYFEERLVLYLQFHVRQTLPLRRNSNSRPLSLSFQWDTIPTKRGEIKR